MARAVLEVRGLWVGEGPGAAVRGVSFEVGAGRVLGIQGGAGDGKSRLLRCVGLDYPPTSGGIFLHGMEISAAPPAERRDIRARRVELVHPPVDDADSTDGPAASVLGRRRTTTQPVGHPLTVPVAGLRQRIQIARAFSHRADVLLLDEPLAGVEAAVAGRIIELLQRLRTDVGTALVIASRDDQLMGALADEVLVLRQGVAVGLRQTGPHPARRGRPRPPAILPRRRRSA